MDHVSYFKNFFESIADYRNIVLFMFLYKKNVDLLQRIRFLEKRFFLAFV